jgi:hypothetical protein
MLVALSDPDIGTNGEGQTGRHKGTGLAQPAIAVARRQFLAYLLHDAGAQIRAGPASCQTPQDVFWIGIHVICPAKYGFRRTRALR